MVPVISQDLNTYFLSKLCMPEVRYKDLGETLFIKMFGYSPKLRILDIFLDNTYFDFSKSEVMRELRMNKPSTRTLRIWRNWE